jgi:filamentous hemagglutinin family protein
MKYYKLILAQITMLITLPSLAFAEIVEGINGAADTQNINSPSNGTSYNQFDDFNVGSNGLDINNGLGAHLIINEVTGGSNTTLSGNINILYNSADLVIANPNGIVVNGARFNTNNNNISNLNLITGRYNQEDKNFNISETGKIIVQNNGLDVKNVNYSNLISRSIEIVNDGIIANDKTLNLLTGNDVATLNEDSSWEVTSDDNKEENKPILAIDAHNFGSIAAGNIYFLATEKGVGVNMESPSENSESMIKGAGVINISSRGDVQYGNLSDFSEVNITSDHDIEGDDGSSIQSSNVNFNANNVKNNGQIIAAYNINIEADNDITNNGSIGDNNYGKTTITANSLNNNGLIDGRYIDINSDTITNNGNIKSNYTDFISISGVNIATKILDNSGTIMALQDLTIRGNDESNNYYSSKITNNGEIYSVFENLDVYTEQFVKDDVGTFTDNFENDSNALGLVVYKPGKAATIHYQEIINNDNQNNSQSNNNQGNNQGNNEIADTSGNIEDNLFSKPLDDINLFDASDKIFSKQPDYQQSLATFVGGSNKKPYSKAPTNYAINNSKDKYKDKDTDTEKKLILASQSKNSSNKTQKSSYLTPIAQYLSEKLNKLERRVMEQVVEAKSYFGYSN